VSYNGSGTFNINTTGQPVVAGTVISSSAFNALTTDLATGLTTAITKDGQTTTTARITFAQGITSSLTTDSSSISTGSIITAGGAGIAKNLYVGGIASFSAQPIFTSLTASSAVATDASKGLVSVTNTGTGNNVLGTAPTIASANLTTALTLTGASGTAGQALTSGGSGVAPTWTTISATPGGSTTQVQYNSSGAFAGSANMTFSGTALTLANDASISGLTVGRGAGAVSTNTVVGSGSLNGGSQTGTFNTVIGYQAAIANTTGNSFIAIGPSTFAANTTGSDGIAIGSGALQANTTGGSNTGVGRVALYSNTTGSYNTALGSQALYSNTGTGSCTAVGYQAGYAVNGSAGNFVAIGYQCANNFTNGFSGTFIGTGVQSGAPTGNNEIVIGTNGQTGKGSSTGFIAPSTGGVYQGNNSSSWSTTSDFRLKKNIVDNTEGLDIVSQIRVRNFEYRTAEEVTELPAHTVIDKQGVQLGVIAQELQEVCSDCVKEESTGVLSVDTSNLTWHMINAIKDLKALVDAQATEITALKAKVGI